jgi:hypothetical protein
MRIRLTLQPHQRGAKQLLAQYGNRLVWVRYRYDAQNKKRFKTVELIVEERAWDPDGGKWQADRLVPVRVTVTEFALRQQVKHVGGKWNPQRGVWEVRYDQVLALGLTDRIVEDCESI